MRWRRQGEARAARRVWRARGGAPPFTPAPSNRARALAPTRALGTRIRFRRGFAESTRALTRFSGFLPPYPKSSIQVPLKLHTERAAWRGRVARARDSDPRRSATSRPRRDSRETPAPFDPAFP